jgi:hypothetical protein
LSDNSRFARFGEKLILINPTTWPTFEKKSDFLKKSDFFGFLCDWLERLCWLSDNSRFARFGEKLILDDQVFEG